MEVKPYNRGRNSPKGNAIALVTTGETPARDFWIENLVDGTS